MSDTQLRYLLLKDPPLILQAVYTVHHGMRVFWHRYCRDILFAFIMQQITRIRVFMLLVEHNLFRVGHRLRERRAKQKPSIYWRDLHGWHKTVRWNKRGQSDKKEKHIEIREYSADEFSRVEISRE